MTLINCEIEFSLQQGRLHAKLDPSREAKGIELPSTLHGHPLDDTIKALWELESLARDSGLESGFSRDREPRRRQIATSREVSVKAIGSELFGMIDGDALANHLETIAIINNQIDTPKNIRLVLSFDTRSGDISKLLRLPWETLFGPSHGFFALHSGFSVVRKISSQTPRKFRSLRKIRVLVVTANVKGMSPINSAEEVAALKRVAAEKGNLRYRVLGAGAFTQLRSTLRTGKYQVLHFIGHGEAPSSESAQGHLVFESSDHEADRIDAETFVSTIADQKSLQLVLVNCCHGAATVGLDSDIASRLATVGVPSTIAMQAKLSNEAAVAFTHEFYSQLAVGQGFERAVVEARHAMSSKIRHAPEWAKPVLYLQHAIDFSARKRFIPHVSRLTWLIAALLTLLGWDSYRRIEEFRGALQRERVAAMNPQRHFPKILFSLEGDTAAPPAGTLSVRAGTSPRDITLDDDGNALWMETLPATGKDFEELIVSAELANYCAVPPQPHDFPNDRAPPWEAALPVTTIEVCQGTQPRLIRAQYIYPKDNKFGAREGTDWSSPTAARWRRAFESRLETNGFSLTRDSPKVKCILHVELIRDFGEIPITFRSGFSVDSRKCKSCSNGRPAYAQPEIFRATSGIHATDGQALDELEDELLTTLGSHCNV